MLGSLKKVHTSGACPICLEDMSEPKKIVITKCSHAFHEKCMTIYLSKRKEPNCPYCRQTAIPMVRAEKSSDSSKENPYIECRMFRALRDGDLDYINAALLAEPHLVDGLYENKKNHRKYPLLTLAAMFGHQDLVTFLLNKVKKESINECSSDGFSALSVACLFGHTQIAELLLNADAKANNINADGKSALWFAAYAGKKELIELLVQFGSSVTNKSKDNVTALLIAAQKGHLEVVNHLINAIPKEELKEHINICSSTTITPATALFMAAKAGHTDVVSSLVSAGADPNQAIGGGQIPLHVAASNGHSEVINILIKKGTNVNYQRPDGATALFLGAAEGRREVCEHLLKANANRDLTCEDFSRRQVSAAEVARDNGYLELAEYIKNYQHSDI